MNRLDPPVYITDGVAKSWLSQFHGKQRIQLASQVEAMCGVRIKACKERAQWSAKDLVVWLSRECSVVVSLRVAQDWISTQWGSDGLLCIPEQVEELMGDRLRLEQYRVCLLTEYGAGELSRRLQDRVTTTTSTTTIITTTTTTTTTNTDYLCHY